jgi:maltose O-acetyltransferase
MLNKLKKYIVQRNLRIGINSEIDSSCSFANIQNIKIGNYVYIGAQTFLDGKGGIEIGDGSILSSRITILTSSHDFEELECLPYSIKNINKKVVIKEGCWIGMNVTILPGIIIEEGSIIGAGSVVTKNVKKGSIVAGNPAILLKTRDLESIDKLVNNKEFLLKKYGENRRK